MTAAEWLERLQWLVVRVSGIGLNCDLAALPLADLWGVYCLLVRLSGEVPHGSEP